LRKDNHLSLPNDVFRSPTYAPHLATALVWMLKHHKEMVSGIYNVVNTGSPSLFEIGSNLSMSSKSGINITIADRDTYAKTHGREPSSMPKYTALDGSKFGDISPIKLPSWQEAIDEFASAWED
jgi:dTDP-4-dehydrorhamnose reductase